MHTLYYSTATHSVYPQNAWHNNAPVTGDRETSWIYVCLPITYFLMIPISWPKVIIQIWLVFCPFWIFMILYMTQFCRCHNNLLSPIFATVITMFLRIHINDIYLGTICVTQIHSVVHIFLIHLLWHSFSLLTCW